MKIARLLESKGHDVVTIGSEQTVLAAMRLLVQRGIGAVVVTEDDRITGILSERDVLRLGARAPEALASTLVAEVMTTDLVIGLPEDDLGYVMEVMTRNRIRHLPILADGRLTGIVSIGDVVDALHRSTESENRYLRDYIQGVFR